MENQAEEKEGDIRTARADMDGIQRENHIQLSSFQLQCQAMHTSENQC